MLVAMMLVFGSAAPACAGSTADSETMGIDETDDHAATQEIGSTGGTIIESEIANDAADQESQNETETISKYQKGLAAYIRSKNKNLSKSWSITLAGYFIKSGGKNDVDPKVLMALALRESNFRAKAKSKYGYKGIMQLSDAFARNYGYKPSDLYKASVSIEIAAKYISKMKKKYKTYTNAICCYICGSGSVANGTHSKEPGRSVMRVRTSIKEYLKKNGYA